MIRTGKFFRDRLKIFCSIYDGHQGWIGELFGSGDVDVNTPPYDLSSSDSVQSEH